MKLLAFNKAPQMRVLGFYVRVTMPHAAYLYLYEVWRKVHKNLGTRVSAFRFWRDGNILIWLCRFFLAKKKRVARVGNREPIATACDFDQKSHALGNEMWTA